MQQPDTKPTLDFTRKEAVRDIIDRLSAPSDSGKTMRNQMRDGTLTVVELSNGRRQPISPATFPEIFQWFDQQEIAMGITKPKTDPALTMTPKEWAGVEEAKDEIRKEVGKK